MHLGNRPIGFLDVPNSPFPFQQLVRRRLVTFSTSSWRLKLWNFCETSSRPMGTRPPFLPPQCVSYGQTVKLNLYPLSAFHILSPDFLPGDFLHASLLITLSLFPFFLSTFGMTSIFLLFFQATSTWTSMISGRPTTTGAKGEPQRENGAAKEVFLNCL